MNPVEFGQYLKSLREKLNLTMRELDKQSGVSHSYISQLERGKRGIPSPEILSKLAGPLGESPLNLMIKAGHIKIDGVDKIATNIRDLTPSSFFSQIKSSNIANVIVLFHTVLDRITLCGENAEHYLELFREGLNSFLIQSGISLNNLRELLLDKESKEPKPLFTTLEDAAILDQLLTLLSIIAGLEQDIHDLGQKNEELFERNNMLLDLSVYFLNPNIHYDGKKITEHDKQLIKAYLQALFTSRMNEINQDTQKGDE